MFVAQDKGYFEANSVKVEFVPVASAAERDQLIQAGEIDGMINDMISTILFNKDAVQVVAVGFSRVATDTYPQFRILASAQSGITSVEQLKGVEIGVSDGTVIAYTTDRLLQAEGFTADDIKTIAVPKIPDRLALLGSGELKAANLPDPLASLAVAGGAVVIIDDTKHPEYGYSLYTFTAKFAADHPGAVKGFLAAVYQAAADINADKTQWDGLLADQALLPQPLQGNYTLPDYPTGDVPSEDQFNDVLAWAKDKGIVAADVSYTDSVSANFLP
jgi:NitT/TauT family transport system substrate-binding protein